MDKNSTIAAPSQYYYDLRIFLRKRRRLLRFAQILRSMLILGPLRQPIIRYFQTFRNNVPLQIDENPLFPDLDVDKVVDRINAMGYSNGITLPEKELTEILEYCEKNKRVRNWNPHKDCKAIDKLSRNAAIVEVARKYLGAEPLLWLTELRWTVVGPDKENFPLSRYQEPNLYDVFSFHYDVLDYKSLTVFVYLTDVELECGPHVTIEGTHRNKSLKELTNIVISDDVAQKKYGNKIKVLLGNKGSVFFEETSAYHKAAECKKTRLILKMDYVLRRKAPPERGKSGSVAYLD